ncbi:hypothetical protein Ahy_B09g095630 isoform A [Arachis hypogaea]|uniref:Aminotransferase-like plant mobile domain-containing protein n=1 Tax=Arachis hypogaea TaxID=3818 RepID=A0A444XG85_ARAHY|nr:hypothetical protein Ahy_B09g095630 isoform A [Arachis hypogaea]
MPLHDKIIPYLERVCLYHLTRLNTRWFWMDKSLDVAYQLGLSIDGKAVSGCLTDFVTWFHERFRVLPANATEDTVRIYARAHIMMLLSTQLFGDKSENWVHIRWLPFVARLDEMGTYSWVRLRWHGYIDACVRWSTEM